MTSLPSPASAPMAEPHKCQIAPGEIEHDWQYVSDWYGDPGVINGTADCSFKRCRVCGEEAPLEDGEFDDYGGDYDDF